MTTTQHEIRSADWRKVAGVGLLLVPIGLLLLLGIGEMAGGDISGIQHIVEVAVLVSLAVIAWKRPRIGGTILVGLGALLAILYVVAVDGRFPLWALLITELMLFGPAIVSGLLLLTAAQTTSSYSMMDSRDRGRIHQNG